MDIDIRHCVWCVWILLLVVVTLVVVFYEHVASLCFQCYEDYPWRFKIALSIYKACHTILSYYVFFVWVMLCEPVLLYVIVDFSDCVTMMLLHDVPWLGNARYW